jgi:hypothetical protein
MNRRFNQRKRHLAQQILAAMGVSAIALTACTAEVIVVETETGPSVPTTQPPTQPPTQPFNCAEPEYGSLEYACVATVDGGCPSTNDVYVQLSDMLNNDCTDTGPNNGCGCYEYVSDVACGPDPNVTDQCCYFATMQIDDFCEGRPFAVHGEARVASAVRRSDWCGSNNEPFPSPNLDGLDATTREALAAAWESDGLFEHASVASFARFVLELLSVGAPPEMVRDAQQALADEIRHAETCFALASAYRGQSVGPGELAIEGGLSERHDLASIAVATFVEGCVNETLATLVAHAAAAEARDETVVAAINVIAHDESRHAALAWRFVAWACRKDRAARRAVTEAIARVSASADTFADPSGADVAKMRNHGQLANAERRRVIAVGLSDVVLPAAQSLLDSMRDRGASVADYTPADDDSMVDAVAGRAASRHATGV